MKQHLKRFGIGFGVMAAMHIIYSAYARGVVNLTACLCVGVAGGLLFSIGYAQYIRHSNTGKQETKEKNPFTEKKDKEE